MSDNDAGNGTPRGHISPQDREAFQKRSEDLGRRLDAVKTRREPPPDNTARGHAMAQGFKIAVELVVGVVFGGLLGWGLDRFVKQVLGGLITVAGVGIIQYRMSKAAKRQEKVVEPR